MSALDLGERSYRGIILSSSTASTAGGTSSSEPSVFASATKERAIISSASTQATTKSGGTHETSSSFGTIRESMVAPAADYNLERSDQASLSVLGEDETRGAYLKSKFGQSQLNTFENIPMEACSANRLNQVVSVELAVHQRAKREARVGIMEAEKRESRKSQIKLCLVTLLCLGIVGAIAAGMTQVIKQPIEEESSFDAASLCRSQEEPTMFSLCLSENIAFSCIVDSRLGKTLQRQTCPSCQCETNLQISHDGDKDFDICTLEESECIVFIA